MHRKENNERIKHRANMDCDYIALHHVILARKKRIRLENRRIAHEYYVAMINCGVNGRVAMEQVDLFPDVAQAWADSRDMIEKYQKSLIKKDDTQQQTQKRTMSDLSDQTGNSPILDGMNTDNGGDEDVHES